MAKVREKPKMRRSARVGRVPRIDELRGGGRGSNPASFRAKANKGNGLIGLAQNR
jgi:hypothetical protein